ncbi:LamG domain-containing protein [Rhizobiales bacterium L72]|uniref:LamG domain-containing protein n=2 Tax=Propylenella binzhouense TaxID=2555902 RepID=A0A964WRS9_9HYPH|nr:LamG domain-containing protein [Propylenella binzhouense]
MPGERLSSGPVHIHAYVARISVRAGEALDVMVSAAGTSEVEAQLVRLLHGDVHPAGPGFREEEIDCPANGRLAVSWRDVPRGNVLRGTDAGGALLPQERFTLWAYIHPALPGAGVQTLVSYLRDGGEPAGYALCLDEQGCLAFFRHDAQGWRRVLGQPQPVLAHCWYLVTADIDPAGGQVVLASRHLPGRANGLWSRAVPRQDPPDAAGPLEAWTAAPGPGTVLVGGRPAEGGPIECLYNGKIDRFGLIRGGADKGVREALAAGTPLEAARTLAFWDTTAGYGPGGIGDVVRDLGPSSLDLVGVNRPVRGQTGWNWDGCVDSFRLAPEQYGGIEFHDDALADCLWPPTVTLQLSADLRSGVYALRLRHGGVTERAVFCVRPARRSAPICFLLPTATYMAYANGPRSMEGDIGQALMGRSPILARADIEACENNYLFGLSAYDVHRDGAGVCYTSYRRPIFTMQPDYRFPGVAAPWGLGADLSIIAWLEQSGHAYDVITDEDLDREGRAALDGYRVLITGSHAEYASEPMLDAIEDFSAGGGRILYLSGNGLYWVVAFRPEEPWVMEIRRREAGSRAWQCRPGEGYLVTTGEPGGLWRHRNRAPQKLVGVGFASEGMDISVPFRRMPASFAPEVAWILEGVEGELIGDFGLIHGGVVGLEIDRYDAALGSPPGAVVLASSEPLTSNWPLVQEEIFFSHPGLGGDEHPQVRCDMVYFRTANGGAVFSASSIAWAGALPWNDFDNAVSRIMANVVNGFLSDGGLPDITGAADAR